MLVQGKASGSGRLRLVREIAIFLTSGMDLLLAIS